MLAVQREEPHPVGRPSGPRGGPPNGGGGRQEEAGQGQDEGQGQEGGDVEARLDHLRRGEEVRPGLSGERQGLHSRGRHKSLHKAHLARIKDHHRGRVGEAARRGEVGLRARHLQVERPGRRVRGHGGPQLEHQRRKEVLSSP